MTKNLEELYFEWLLSFVYNDHYFKNLSYRRILKYLYLREFYYILPMDENRCQDGIDLRYRFGRENNIDDREISTSLDIRPCSVLEMMVALSCRIEESIMINYDIGNRTGQWFWEMMNSLGLSHETDSNFNIQVINDILYDFLERNYEPNGHGGLFTLNNPPEDLRRIEIWYQMNWYLEEIKDD